MRNLNKVEFNCTGCGLCSNVCPKDAITIEYDKEGFYHYVLDEEKCINCGLCTTKCPQLNFKNNNDKAYVCSAYSKNDSAVKKSSSGGMFYELAKYILEENGVVVGVEYTDKVKHTLIRNLDELEQLMGSKYLQSYTGNIYNLVREEIRNNKKVLFTGTPCQCAAMRNFVDSENLFIVDIVCHGVPSIDVFNKANKDRFTEEVNKVNFRDKSVSWEKYQIIYKNNDKVVKTIDKSNDEFFIGYINNSYLMKSCYACKFSTGIHTSDITLGDYWGIKEIDPEFYEQNNGKGISVVVLNSDKGIELFRRIHDRVTYKRQDYNEVLFRNNPRINNGTYGKEALNNRNYFYEKDYNTSFKKKRYTMTKLKKLKAKLKSPLIKLKAKILKRK